MLLENVVLEAANIFKLVLPFLFLGLFLSAILHRSSYLEHLGKPFSKLASLSNLPSYCSAVFTTSLTNKWAGLAMLSDLNRRKIVSDRQVIVTALVCSLPKGIRITLLVMAPLAVPVLGFSIGLSFLFLVLLTNLAVSIVGIVIGKIYLKPMHHSSSNIEITFPKQNEKWSEKLKKSLSDTVRQFKSLLIIFVPAVMLVLLFLELGLKSWIVGFTKPILSPLGLPASSTAAIGASVVSQLAVIGMVGTLIANETISQIQCLLLLFITRFVHLGIGIIKMTLPLNISLFGKNLGLKVALATCLALELAIAGVILLLVGIL